MEQTSPLRSLRIEPQFRGHDGADVGHLTGVLQQVLAIRGTVFHSADHSHELDVETVDSQVDTCSFSSLKDFILKLFLDFRHNFLDAGRMDTPVDHKLVESQPCDLPADRIEC